MLRGGVKYADAGGVSIAYETYGDGPIDIVLTPGFVSHLDLMTEVPAWLQKLDELAKYASVTVFDKRGTGESERTGAFGSAAERMDDIRAVMDAAGLDRAALYGISEGGPLSILFAATYPDRVDRLVLEGTFARMTAAPDHPVPDTGDPDEFLAVIADLWGQGEIVSVMVQGEPEHRPFAAKFERSACSPKMAVEIMAANLGIDVRDALSTISVPALVLHQVGDGLVPVWHGRFLAEHIPGAEYVELDGQFHFTYDRTNQPAMWAALHHFFTGAAPQERIDRVLSTVLFTDIVESTSQAVAMGDDRWRDLLDRHDKTCRTAVERHDGVLVKSTGDGILGRFEGPGRAVACAQDIRREVGPLGIDVRAGLHTGEVELRGDDVAGIAVHIASRISAKAGAGEVLVSRTVRDLTAGSGLALEDRGEHDLKGLDEPWHLYAATN